VPNIINDLTTGSVPKKLILFALPFMLSMLLQTLYSTVDMVVVGQFIGSTGLSAVSISSQLIWLVTALCMGFTVAGQIVISQLVGAGKRTDLRVTIGTLICITAIGAVVLSVAGICLARPMLNLLNTPEEAYSRALGYLTIVFSGTIFIFGYNLVSAVLRGMGDSKHPFIFVVISSLTNLVLAYVFVGIFHWDVAGSAIATVMSQAVSFIISAVFLYKNRESFGFDFKLKSFRIDGRRLKQLTMLGLPLALQSCAISISFLFVNKFVNAYGLTASATFGTGTRIEQIPWVIVSGVQLACAAMVGQNMGAGKFDRAKKTVNTSIFISAASAFIFVLVFHFFPKELYSLFTSDVAVLEMAPMFMLVLTISVPATSLMCPYCAFIEGIGNANLTLFIALMDGFVTRILLSLLLDHVFHLGLMSYFLGYGLAAYVTTIIGAGYFYSGIWKKRKLLV